MSEINNNFIYGIKTFNSDKNAEVHKSADKNLFECGSEITKAEQSDRVEEEEVSSPVKTEDDNETYLSAIDDFDDYAENDEGMFASNENESKINVSAFGNNVDVESLIEEMYFTPGEITDKKVESTGSNVITVEKLSDGGEIVTVVEYAPNGVETTKKEIKNSEGKVTHMSEKTKDPVHKYENTTFSEFDERGKIKSSCSVRTDLKGNITKIDGLKYSYFEYKNNTSNPVISLTLETPDANGVKTTLIKNLASGELDIKKRQNDTETVIAYDKDGNKTGSEITVENENGLSIKTFNADDKIVSERKFTPAENSSAINNAGYGNEGDYVSYVFDENEKAKVSYGLHIDENGNRTAFGEEEKMTSAAEVNYQLNFDNIISDTKQGEAGDCWLLSAVNSLSYSPKGQKIIDDAIEYKEDYATVHTYFGDYKVTYDEVTAAKKELIAFETENSVSTGLKYTSGDDDITVIELAVEKLRTDISSGVFKINEKEYSDGYLDNDYYPRSNDNKLFGGLQSEAVYYLTGNRGIVTADAAEKHNLLDMYINNKENSVMEIGMFNSDNLKDADGKILNLPTDHAYSVKDADEKYVTITNPWDSGKDIVLNRADLENADVRFGYTDLTEIVKDKEQRLPG